MNKLFHEFKSASPPGGSFVRYSYRTSTTSQNFILTYPTALKCSQTPWVRY